MPPRSAISLAPEDIVGGHPRRLVLAAEICQQLQKFSPGFGIEAGGRFIQQDYFGVLHDGDRDPEAGIDMLPTGSMRNPNLTALLLITHPVSESAFDSAHCLAHVRLRP